MTFGRVEVYHDGDFLKKESKKGSAALVARFTCTTEQFAQSEVFVRFCKTVCHALYEAEGKKEDLSGTFCRDMAHNIKSFKETYNEEVAVTDIEYISL